MTRRFACAAALLALAGCGSSDRVAGGGGIEIPNGIEVAVHDSLGRPVVGARILVVAEASWAARLAAGSSAILDSGSTDAQGRAVVPPRDEPFWLEVQAGDGTAARLSSRSGTLLQAIVQPTAALSGRIPDGEPRANRMLLAGTSRSAVVDSLGRFTFEKVAQGRYALVAEGVPGVPTRVPSGSAIVGSLGTQQIDVHVDTSALLLDDFSDGDVDWSLREIFGSAYWWMNADVPTDSLASVFGISTAAQAIRTAGGERTISVSVSKAVLSPSWANFGLALGHSEDRLPRLDAFQAARFRVRGTGSWAILLASDSARKEDTWRYDFSPDTAWTTMRIPASAFRNLAGASLPARTRLENFVFQTQEEGSLEIDDLALEGITLEDWSH